MSGARENRAAVFTSEPQDVEVYRNGVWWPGSLLGWRHDLHGACQVWVRASVAGADETTWTGLDALRLPEPAAAPAPVEPLGAAAMGGLSEMTATMSLFAVRDLPAARELPGRAAGVRRAADAVVPVPRSEFAPRSGASAGRHRAPAAVGGGSGRHRAADTGVWPALASHVAAMDERHGAPVADERHGAPVADEMPTRALPGSEDGPFAGGRVTGGARTPSAAPFGHGGGRDRLDPDTVVAGRSAESDAAFYTRPMRLEAQTPRGRRPRWSDSFDGSSASGL